MFLAALMVLSVFAMSVSFAGAAAASHDTDETVTVSADAAASADIVFQGQTIEADEPTENNEGVWGDSVTLRDGDDGSYVDSYSLEEGTVEIDTTDLEEGTYSLDGDIYFEVVVQSFGAEFADESVTAGEDTTVDVDRTNRPDSYDIYVESEDFSSAELAEMFGGIEAHGDGALITDAPRVAHQQPVSIPEDVEAGEYNFTFSVTDTTAEAELSLEVNESSDADAKFDQSTYSEEAGDIVEFTVEMENGAESAQIELTEENDNYNPTLEVTDGNGDGEVTVSFNTYLAGEENGAAFSTVNGEDNVVFANDPVDFDQTGDDSRLLPAAFDLQLFLGEGEDREEVDIAALFLTEGSIDSATSSTAPNGADLNDVESINNATTVSDEIAEGDNVVVAFDASGVFGSDFEQHFNLVLDRTADAYDGEELTSDDYKLVEDPENDRFFVVLNTEDMEAGDEFELVLEPTDDSLYFIDDKEYKKGSGVIVSAEFSIVERMIEVTGDFNKEDQLLVPNDEEAVITGESNAAPGTDVRVQLRATGEDPFLMSQTVQVQEDGSVEATFDLSEHQADQEFTVTMTDQNDRDVQAQVNAILTESADGDRHTVTVNVEDADGNAVSGAEISAGDESATTDDDGKATLKLAHGEYKVSASYDGEKASGKLTVNDNSPDEVTLTLGEENVDLNDEKKDDENKNDDKQNDNNDEKKDDDDEQPGSGPDEDQPGFGIVVALVALLAAAGFALRRQ